KVIQKKDLYFKSNSTSQKIDGENSHPIDFVLNFGDKGQYIHSYTLSGIVYLVDFNIKILNDSEYISTFNTSLDINWSQSLPSLESSIKEERLYSNVYYRNTEKNVDELSSRKDDDQIMENGLQWVSFKQKFFNNSLISSEIPFESGARLKVKPE